MADMETVGTIGDALSLVPSPLCDDEEITAIRCREVSSKKPYNALGKLNQRNQKAGCGVPLVITSSALRSPPS